MQRNVQKQAKNYLRKHKKWKKWQKLVMGLACVVVFCTVYALILPAITASSKTSCGYEEHIHDEKCNEKELVCTKSTESEVHTHTDACVTSEKSLSCEQAESEGHEHTDACYSVEQSQICDLEENESHAHDTNCYQEVKTLICEQAESEGHSHGDACYTDTSTYICGMEEGQEIEAHEHSDDCYESVMKCELEVHEHTLVCFSDPNADVETKEVWERTFENVELTGDWSEDLIAIAESQLGYEESTENYTVEDGQKKGYTRYGDWYGNKYGDWCAMFVSFCLNYAEVENIPFEAGCQNWINKLKDKPYEFYYEASEYTPERGDIIFFNWDDLSDADHVGIVVEYIEATEYEPAMVKTIEGNASDVVKYKEYEIGAATIMGYGKLPLEPQEEVEVEETEEIIEEVIEETEAIERTLTATVYENSNYNKEANDGTIITVTGIFTEDIEVKAYPVEIELEDQDVIYAYDITLFKADGSIYEPTEDTPVIVKITSPEFIPEDTEVEPGMYYVPEEGEPEQIGSTIEEDGVTFTAEHFSVYALIAPSDATGVYNQRQLRNRINEGASYIQLTGDITVNNNGDAINVPANADITLDLNGYTITSTRESAIFNITSNGKLTVGDSRASSESVGSSSGDKYGREATLSVDSDGNATLTYYVTTSRVTDTAKGLTAESLEKHTVTTRGAIVGNNQPVFNVTNGTLVIDSGMIRSGSGRAINQTGGTVNLEGGYICGFTRSSSSTDSDTAFGGAIITTGGTINLTGSVLAANTAQNGGAIFAKAEAVINITAGVISGNTANRKPTNGWNGHSEGNIYRCGGGGIYSEGTVSITMNNGYITNNIATDNGYFDGGGGVSLSGQSTFTLNNGFVTGNKAAGGGGIRTNFNSQTVITMNGGFVSSNMTTDAEGAGIALDNKGLAYINAGYITNNILPYTEHWGGGGLFCADGSTMHLKNALITENKSGGFGAGVAGCPTGHLYLYVERGCAIYNNTDLTEANGKYDAEPNFVNGGAKNGVDVERCVDEFLTNGHADYFCALQSTVTNAMLGGSFANWQGSADYDEVQAAGQKDIMLSAETVMGLTAHPTDAGIVAAQKEAQLYITGNYSYTHGGGIMCNGNLVVGIPIDVEIPVHLSVQGSKSFISNIGNTLSLENNNFVFIITDENGNEVAEGYCDKNGKITFDRQIVIKKAGKYVYEVKEKVPENAGSDVQYDTKVYRITVEVERDQGEAWYGETWKYTHEITSLVVEASNGEGKWTPVIENEATQSGTVVVLPDEKMISFTNIKTDIIDMKVIKKWVGKTSDIDSVTVNLLRNDEVIDTKILNEENNWQYIWENLKTKDENGQIYSYKVTENFVDGYIISYEELNESVIHTTTITNTNINDARFNLDLTKVSEEHPELTLAGAEFELIDHEEEKLSFTGEDGVYTVVDSSEEEATTTVITGEDGKLLLKEIPAGIYILREIKAPEGYGLADDIEVIINEYSEPTIKITVEDPEKQYAMPETGGIGTNMFVIGGMSLMLISLLYGYATSRKRERGIR